MRSPGETLESNPMYRQRVNIVVGLPDDSPLLNRLSNEHTNINNNITNRQVNNNSNTNLARHEERKFTSLLSRRAENITYEGIKKIKKNIFYKDSGKQTILDNSMNTIIPFT
jgi:hypothetical protein